MCIRDSVWIVYESKVVDTIGKFPLPVEVIPFGAGQVIKKFEARGYKPVLRLDADGKEVRTDENNFVVDLHLERIDHPQELAEDLINTVGVDVYKRQQLKSLDMHRLAQWRNDRRGEAEACGLAKAIFHTRYRAHQMCIRDRP